MVDPGSFRTCTVRVQVAAACRAACEDYKERVAGGEPGTSQRYERVRQGSNPGASHRLENI